MYFPHRVFPNNKRSIRSCHVKCRVCVHSTFEHVGLSCCYSLIGDCLVSLESLLYSIIFRKVLFFLMNFSILFFPPISLSTQISTSFELLFASVKQANFSPSRFEISSNKRSILISSKFFSFFFSFFCVHSLVISSISRCFYGWKKKKKTKEKKERAQDKLIYPLFNPNVEVNSSEGRRAKRDNVGATRQEDSRFLSTEKLFSSLRLLFFLLHAHTQKKREREREVSGGATIIT